MQLLAKLMMCGAFGYVAGYTVEDFSVAAVLTVVFALAVGVLESKA